MYSLYWFSVRKFTRLSAIKLRAHSWSHHSGISPMGQCCWSVSVKGNVDIFLVEWYQSVLPALTNIQEDFRSGANLIRLLHTLRPDGIFLFAKLFD
jgi:hypothetical protein